MLYYVVLLYIIIQYKNYVISIFISGAVKWLIVINRIQNTILRLWYICVCILLCIIIMYI